MKRLILTAVFAAAASATFAQSSTTGTPTEPQEPKTVTTQPAENKDERKEVKVADLPGAVQTELGTVQYKGWTPSTAWWVREGKMEYYEITMVNGNESKKVKYNSEGSKLE